MLQLASLNNPIGPDVISADTHELNLSGTRVRFKAPIHTAQVISFEPFPTTQNIYNESNYVERSQKNEGFDFLLCYTCQWGIHGLPLIQRHIGKINFSVNVVKTTKEGSLLQPSFVETAIAEHLNEVYGPSSGVKNGPVNARVNWSSSTIKQHIWLSFDTEFPHDRNGIKHYYLPITDSHMLRVSVSCYTYHKKAKLKPYFQQLCQQLIESFEVELSGDALLQQQRAKERWPEERYSDYLPPFHWQPEHRETSLFARSSTLAE